MSRNVIVNKRRIEMLCYVENCCSYRNEEVKNIQFEALVIVTHNDLYL